MISELFESIKIDLKVFLVIVRSKNTYLSDWKAFLENNSNFQG